MGSERMGLQRTLPRVRNDVDGLAAERGVIDRVLHIRADEALDQHFDVIADRSLVDGCA
jgi:hypothetical protein